MKIVIDIDEDVYNEIKSIVRKPESLYPLDVSIRNGIPLVEFCDSCIYKKDEDD